MLPPEVVQEDNRLEKASERSQEKLARHRWHWTLDESNPDRVSLRAYAKSVAVSYFAITKMVNGYAAWLVRGENGTDLTLYDFIEKAKVGAEKGMAAEALAKATSTTIGNVLSNKRDEVSRVVVVAQERAERRGTTTAEEIPGVVEWRTQARTAAKTQQAARVERHGLRWIEIEGHVAKAQQELRRALETAKDVEFTDEELELMRDAIGQMRAFLDLLDLRLAGSPDVDWDAELAALNGKENQ